MSDTCKHGVVHGMSCASCGGEEYQRYIGAVALSIEGAKPSNPKDAIATDKAPLHLVPAAFKAYTALALAEGAMKYGAHNWRAAGVRASIYVAALQRHMDKWWNGENNDPHTGVPHLANACACLAILIDALISEQLTDDRPPRQENLSSLLDSMMPNAVATLRQTFAGSHPRHWTIADEINSERE